MLEAWNLLWGILVRFLYDPVKKALKLSDAAAAWGLIAFALAFTVVVKLIEGNFGISIPWNNPPEALKALTEAWAQVLATATLFYAMTKKRS